MNRQLVDDQLMQRIFESTSEQRRLRRVQAAEKAEDQQRASQVLPIVFVAVAASLLVHQLHTHWRVRAKQTQLIVYARRWRQRTQCRIIEAQHAELLRKWLQKSVKMKNLALKVR